MTDAKKVEDCYLYKLAHAPQGLGQGLTLVHFSAQPEPFLTQIIP